MQKDNLRCSLISLKDRANDIRAQRESVLRQAEDLAAELVRIEHLCHELANEIFPISELPHEILGAIFTSSVSPRHAVGLETEVILSHVSHYWREVALSTPDQKSTRLNSSHLARSRMPSSA